MSEQQDRTYRSADPAGAAARPQPGAGEDDAERAGAEGCLPSPLDLFAARIGRLSPAEAALAALDGQGRPW
jgi:hypothetical protein